MSIRSPSLTLARGVVPVQHLFDSLLRGLPRLGRSRLAASPAKPAHADLTSGALRPPAALIVCLAHPTFLLSRTEESSARGIGPARLYSVHDGLAVLASSARIEFHFRFAQALDLRPCDTYNQNAADSGTER
jgi:hypothetical protein